MLNLSLFATPNVHAVGSWTTGARIPIAVEGYGAAVVGAVHYYFGGYSGGDTSLNQRYSTLTNSWLSNGASLPVPESELSAVTGGGNSCSGGPCLYAVSGRSFPGLLQRYDPVVNNWIFLASMPVPVATEHSVVSTGDKIYVAGGRTSSAPGSGAVNYLQIYDIATDTWSFGPSLPIPVSDAAAIVIDGMIFVFGGFTSNGQIVPTTQIFVISFNRWTIGARSCFSSRASFFGRGARKASARAATSSSGGAARPVAFSTCSAAGKGGASECSCVTKVASRARMR